MDNDDDDENDDDDGNYDDDDKPHLVIRKSWFHFRVEHGQTSYVAEVIEAILLDAALSPVLYLAPAPYENNC